MTRYKFLTKVATVELRKRIVSAKKVGNDVEVVEEEIGWFMRCEGSWEALYLGHERT